MLRRGLAALVAGIIFSQVAAAGDVGNRHSNAVRSQGNLKPAAQMTHGSGRKHGESRAYSGRGAQRGMTAGRMNGQAPGNFRTTGYSENTDVVYVNQNQQAPIPIENAPVIPNMDPTTGPQLFSAVPAGHTGGPVPVYPGQNWQQYSAPIPVHQTSGAQFSPISHEGMQGPVSMGMEGPATFNEPTGQYPETGASLYPAPVPGIPWQIGGASIPNAALHPHEMLYAHRYRAMYPPYYYKVNGGWMVTPFGVWSHEDWKLQGTTVDVNYRSSISPFSLYRGKGH